MVKTLPFHGSNMGSIPIRCMKCYFADYILIECFVVTTTKRLSAYLSTKKRDYLKLRDQLIPFSCHLWSDNKEPP